MLSEGVALPLRQDYLARDRKWVNIAVAVASSRDVVYGGAVAYGMGILRLCFSFTLLA